MEWSLTPGTRVRTRIATALVPRGAQGSVLGAWSTIPHAYNVRFDDQRQVWLMWEDELEGVVIEAAGAVASSELVEKGCAMSAGVSAPPAIVLVDDESFVREVLLRILAGVADGYELLTVADGQAVLEVLTTRPIPLLLTDYHMPGMNGVDLAQAVKAISPATRVVLLTADPSAAQAAVGVDQVILKPFALAELRQIVRAALTVE